MNDGHTPKQLLFGDYYEGGHSMELRRGGEMRWQEICKPSELRMGGFSYARIVSNGLQCY